MNFLDRAFRMTKADSSAALDDLLHIAVPINQACIEAISNQDSSSSPHWLSLVVSRGKQTVPYSTVKLGKKKRIK